MARLVAVAVLFILGVLFAVPVWPAARAEVTKPRVPLAQTTPRPSPSPTARAGVENVGAATKTTINQEQLRQDNSQNTYDAIKAVPGVAQADAKAGGGADNLQIRGVHLPSNTGYRLDGYLPMENNVFMVPEDKELVQVLKGAGALEYGLTSPAGIVNYYLKRATRTPITSLAIQTSQNGLAIVSVDAGRQTPLFGGTFGFRSNVAGGLMGSYVNGAGGTRYVQEFAADWTTKRALIQFGVESFGVDLIENSSVLQNKAVGNVITIPHPVDPSKLLSGTWARGIGTGENTAMKGVYKFSDLFSAQAEVGTSGTTRTQRFVSQLGTINLTTGVGTDTVTLVRDQTARNLYEDFQLKWNAKAGSFVNNEFTLGYTDSGRYSNNPTNGSAKFAQNLYNPVPVPAPTLPATPIVYNPQNDGDHDYFFHDQLNFEGRLHLIGGLRKINYWSNNKNQTTGAANQAYFTTWAPAYALIGDVSGNVSLYASWVKSLEETGFAPVNSANAFSALPPAPAQQSEIGIRTQTPHSASSLAWFRLNLANATTDPVTNIFALNGTQTFSGLEAKTSFDLVRTLTLLASGQYMHAFQTSSDVTISGLRPENTPILSGALGFNYRAPYVRGLTLNGELIAAGSREINPQDQGLISPVTLINTGINYAFRSHAGGRYIATLTCKNCTDRRYWGSAVNGALGIGQPRVITLTVRAAGTSAP